ncbi:YwqG family protein [Streptomyces sp. NPDC101175]|uniref:YwqG family protein n=1 Tax=Streptomyces sp. NPDC101175 TaxID=3366123 RepID=UPI0038368432
MTDERPADRYARLAADHLPAGLAERWTALLRPCVRLRRTPDPERAVATLGGTPDLPLGTAWPTWPGRGPLSFVASVRCAALPPEALPPGFPPDGTLLFFFHYDDQGTGGAGTFHSIYDPGTWAGAQVLHVAAGTPVHPAPVPRELEPYPRTHLAAEVESSAPDLWLPQVRAALLGDGRPWPGPRETEPRLRSFRRAFDRLRSRTGHQLGGHAVPVQGPVEYEVADAELGPGRPWGDPLLDREAERWLVLAQLDSDDDAGMTWGDTGTLYWLIRPEDLTTRRFDRVRLVLQC